jgi:hypothetical protein
MFAFQPKIFSVFVQPSKQLEATGGAYGAYSVAFQVLHLQYSYSKSTALRFL